jgi:hypothetical protein
MKRPRIARFAWTPIMPKEMTIRNDVTKKRIEYPIGLRQSIEFDEDLDFGIIHKLLNHCNKTYSPYQKYQHILHQDHPAIYGQNASGDKRTNNTSFKLSCQNNREKAKSC